MCDSETWTGEPEADVYLYVRVFAPMTQAGLSPTVATRCCVRYGSQSVVTERFDMGQHGSRGKQAAHLGSRVLTIGG